MVASNSTALADAAAAGGGGMDGVTFVLRVFGWSVAALTCCYIVNIYLSYWHGWPGAFVALERAGAAGPLGMTQALSYPAVILASAVGAWMTRGRTLRLDSTFFMLASRYLIRACYWAVILVGIADMVVSFLRVEGLLTGLVGEQLSTALGRPQFRGTTVHIPLVIAAFVIAAVTRSLGFVWLALLVVVAEMQIVLTRFIFSYEQAFQGDLVRFWYAALFLFASAYTLLEDGHVRVDVLYAGLSSRMRGLINALGSALLGLPLCWVILLTGMWSKSSIIISPLLAFEVTQSGFGMYVKYLMAGFLGVFAVTMMFQFISYLLESVADYRDEPGRRDAGGSTPH